MKFYRSRLQSQNLIECLYLPVIPLMDKEALAPDLTQSGIFSSAVFDGCKICINITSFDYLPVAKVLIVPEMVTAKIPIVRKPMAKDAPK